MTMQKLLVVIVLLAIATGPRCSALAERQIQVPALKRIAQLGDLYNGNIDNLINVNVFSRKIPTEYISETQNPIKSTNVAITNSFENQLKIFNTDANEAVNILTGMTPGRGAAGILNQKMKLTQLSGVLIYNYQTVTTSLWAFHEELKDLYNEDILGHIRATHVVTSITWGATVAVTLDASSTEINDVRKTQNSLHKELRSLRGKLLPSDETDSNFSMSITSDVPLPNEIPTTAKEVKEILSLVPTLIAGMNQGKGIPLQYTLTPINMIRKHLGVNMQNATVHKINEFTLSEIVQAFQDLHLAEDQIYEIKEHLNGHSNCVSPQTTATINGIISGFQIFKNNFTTTLKKSVVDVRSGLQETQVLSDLLENFKNSEFSLENLNHIFLNLSSTIEKIALCNTIQNEFSQIQYIGAGDDLISKLTTLQKSEKPVFVMFTNSEFIRNQPETYFESLNSLLEKQKEGADVNLLVNCDFSNSLLCDEPNDTVVFEYVNGTFSPSIQKREIKENIRVLDLEATVVEIRKEVLVNLQKFESILERLEQKLECVANPCLNSGNCTFENNERHCKCLAGFSGDNCETNIDDCAGNNSCMNGATCVDGTSNFSCACATGFTGNYCETNIDDCAGNNSCMNGATCVDGTSNFSCACPTGFTGNYCETNIDDCAENNSCMNGATCVDGTSNFSCACATGFTGNYCETNMDDCAGHNSCLNGATCVDGTSNFSCACATGFTGNYCKTNMDDCAGHNSCLNGATCVDGTSNFSCACATGFTGYHCETNIDDCAGHSRCLNGGACVDGTSNFSCACATGFTGNYCETNMDDCAGHNSCLNGATCVDGTSNFSCACATGFTGNYCETNMDDCAGHNSCLNGATCVDGTSNFSCACATGFTGYHCETNIDDCAGHSRCLNGGACVDRTNSFSCVCTEEYFGNYCEHENECTHPGTCASVKRNAKCRCRDGYIQDPVDSRKCKLENENATLIFGRSGSSVRSGGIEQFSLSQNIVTQILNHKMSNALDLLYRTNSMFWSDESEKIYTAPIRPRAPETVVVDEPGSSIKCLAVDWIFGHVYYAHSNKDNISVANLDGTMKKVLFTTGVTNVNSIVVDPLNGWMYWVDRNTYVIERAGMDGSQRKVLATFLSSIQPWHLALDMTQNRLYWTMLGNGNNPSAIHSMKPDGSDTKIVYQATQPTFSYSGFGSITTFGDYVYWRDSQTKAVYKTNKCGGGEVTKIHSFTRFTPFSDALYTIHAYHFSKQPEGVNHCDNRIGGQCSHLCFPSPSTGNQAVTTKCDCPEGSTLSSNQRTCS